MPELPEVETVCRGISPHIVGAKVVGGKLRDHRLRWPVEKSVVNNTNGLIPKSVRRRGKYILIDFEIGYLMIHLGMSGSLRLEAMGTPPEKHDHFELCFDNGYLLRYRDARRFGSIHWLTGQPENHFLLKSLGPEPLSREFNGDFLFRASRNKAQATKTFIMDSHIVVGVGNIYANEALFDSGILPGTRAGKLSSARCDRLAGSIKKVLRKAIKKGGTTLRDFVGSDGRPGYFQQSLNVYGREGMSCKVCRQLIRSRVLGQRATYYCCHCQH